MDSHNKSDFAIMCRSLRVKKGLKLREVAAAIGVAPSTYGNVESSRFKVIGSHRVARLVELYSLPPDQAVALSAAWERVPLSEYGTKVREGWRKRNTQRSQVKRVPGLESALVELLCLQIGDHGEDSCRCGFNGKLEDSDRACEVCEALAALGLPSFTTADKAIELLSAKQDRIAEAAAAFAATSASS